MFLFSNPLLTTLLSHYVQLLPQINIKTSLLEPTHTSFHKIKATKNLRKLGADF